MSKIRREHGIDSARRRGLPRADRGPRAGSLLRGSTRELARLSEIARVLVRHGLGDVARRLGITRGLARAARVFRRRDGPPIEPAAGAPERLRRALEELGPTFVKLGQVLAGRNDLFPREWTAELAKLREHAASVPWEELRAQLALDLGVEPETLFRDLDPEPLAAASIAQIHAARLADGTPVVLKLRRPGIEEVVEADLRLLEHLAALVERRLPDLARYRPRNVVRQFARSILNELDLCFEARASERIAEAMRAHRELAIPRIHWQWTRRRVCVQERLFGPSAGVWLATGEPAGIDAPGIARTGARLVLEMIFEHGLYHADPHPGNVLFLEDGRLGLVDFGMVGRLSRARRAEFARLLAATVERDEEELAELLLGWSEAPDADAARLSEDCLAFLDRYHGVPLGGLDVAALLSDLAGLVRENRLVLPSDVALLFKVFVTLEDFGRALDPSFDMAAEIEPFLSRTVRRDLSFASGARRGLADLAQIAVETPRELRRALSTLRRGGLRVDFDVARLDAFGAHVERSANRLTVGLITAALIVGTAISATSGDGARPFGLPSLSVLGFASSVAAGVWVLWSIARSRR